MSEHRLYASPPELARELGLAPEKVIQWIRSGELRAVNIAQSRHGRPRWRVAIADWQEFLAGRMSKRPSRSAPAAPKKRPKFDDPELQAWAERFL